MRAPVRRRHLRCGLVHGRRPAENLASRRPSRRLAKRERNQRPGTGAPSRLRLICRQTTMWSRTDWLCEALKPDHTHGVQSVAFGEGRLHRRQTTPPWLRPTRSAKRSSRVMRTAFPSLAFGEGGLRCQRTDPWSRFSPWAPRYFAPARTTRRRRRGLRFPLRPSVGLDGEAPVAQCQSRHQGWRSHDRETPLASEKTA